MPGIPPTACILLIGNELLSGRTQDKNLAYIASGLAALGIRLQEARVIPDDEAVIIATLNDCRARHGYVFTTGGIGPTHDDITSACVAKAFGVPLVRHEEAVAMLAAHYGGAEKLNAARLRMAHVPVGASLIVNPVSGAPGFRMQNVFVMAGVPAICQAMFDGIKGELKGGAPVLAETVTAWMPESLLAEALAAIQTRNSDVEIGSYPFVREGRVGVNLVARGTDVERLRAVAEEMARMCDAQAKAGQF